MNKKKVFQVDEAQTLAMFKRRYQKECLRIHKFMTWLMIGQWIAGICFALFYSPLTWIGQSAQVHIHVWAAILLGGCISGFAITCMRKFPNAVWARHAVAACQVLWSALLIHLTGGRIETHFHVFASLAILSLYRDWKVLITATVFVAVDHLVRGTFYPLSAFGVLSASPYRWIEHAAWVIFEVSFLAPGCVMLRNEIFELCRRQTELISARVNIDQRVKKRTRELESANRKLASKTKEAETLALVARYTDNVVIITDGEARIEWVNDGFQRVTGYTLDDVYGRTKMEMLNGPGTDKDQIAALEDSFLNKRGFDAEMLRYRKDGSSFWMAIESRPILNEDGEVVRFILVESDITKRVEAEIEKQKLNDQLVEASRTAGIAEVATGVLHNVGNVLNSVNVSTNLIQKEYRQSAFQKLERICDLIEEHRRDFPDFVANDKKGQKLPEYIVKVVDVVRTERERICEEISELVSHVDLIKNIVSVQQSMAKTKGLRQKFHVSEVVEDAITANAGALSTHNIKVDKDLAESLQPIESDKQKVLQVLVNLFNNAIDALAGDRSATPELHISAEATEDYVIISVADNGPGIEAEDLHRIFQHGYTTKPDGHGFGLHYCANSATELGGKLTVESDGPGCGAKFSLWVPIESEQNSTSSVRSPELAEGAAS